MKKYTYKNIIIKGEYTRVAYYRMEDGKMFALCQGNTKKGCLISAKECVDYLNKTR